MAKQAYTTTNVGIGNASSAPRSMPQPETKNDRFTKNLAGRVKRAFISIRLPAGAPSIRLRLSKHEAALIRTMRELPFPYDRIVFVALDEIQKGKPPGDALAHLGREAAVQMDDTGWWKRVP